MRLTEKGLELIKKHESFRNNAYQDSAGVWTIGWGNTLYADGTHVKEGDFIYSRDASKLLEIIINKLEEGLEQVIEWDLYPYQWDAIVSLAYNIGIGAFSRSTLLKKLNRDPFDPSILDEFLRWNKAGGKVLQGLIRRRKQEAYLYNNEQPIDKYR